MPSIVRILFSILLFFSALLAGAQQRDRILEPVLSRTDSIARVRAAAARAVQDSVRRVAVQDSLRAQAQRDSLRRVAITGFLKMADSSRYNRHPYFRFTQPEVRIAKLRRWEGKEGLFYGIVALVLIFGLLRNAFARYLADLFRTYFRTTLRQRLIKEQVANAPLPSLLFNLLFLLIGALLAVLLLRHFGMGTAIAFWMLFLYSIAALALMYGVKFIVLKVFGWLLHARDATDTYIFVVFTTNKVMGILLLPVVLGLAFTSGDTYQVFYALALVVVGGLFLYRFYLSFVTVQKLIQINLFHFLLYFCGFELAPLLLINKLLVQFFSQTP